MCTKEFHLNVEQQKNTKKHSTLVSSLLYARKNSRFSQINHTATPNEV
jgi:hypothetical protein